MTNGMTNEDYSFDGVGNRTSSQQLIECLEKPLITLKADMGFSAEHLL